MDLHTDREIEKQYVSSVGGAIAGTLVFGPLGGMIGGRIKEKKNVQVSFYFIISYKSNEQLEYLSFEALDYPKVGKFVNRFKQTHTGTTTPEVHL